MNVRNHWVNADEVVTVQCKAPLGASEQCQKWLMLERNQGAPEREERLPWKDSKKNYHGTWYIWLWMKLTSFFSEARRQLPVHAVFGLGGCIYLWTVRQRSCTPVLLTGSTTSAAAAAAEDTLSFSFFLSSFCSSPPSLFSFQSSFLNIFHFLSFIYPCDANCLLLHARPGTRLWAYKILSDDTFTQEHQSLVMKTEQTWIDAIQVIMLCNDCIESPKEVRDFFKTRLWLRYWNLDIRIAWHSACHLSPGINVSLHFIFTKLIGSTCFHDFQISFLQVIDGGWLFWLTCDYLVISNTHWTLVY